MTTGQDTYPRQQNARPTVAVPAPTGSTDRRVAGDIFELVGAEWAEPEHPMVDVVARSATPRSRGWETERLVAPAAHPQYLWPESEVHAPPLLAFPIEAEPRRQRGSCPRASVPVRAGRELMGSRLPACDIR